MPIINGEYRRPELRNDKINYRYGWFFVTFQVEHNKSELGAIVGEECSLNELGKRVVCGYIKPGGSLDTILSALKISF